LNGVNATIWLLAREQARLGHRVTLLLDEAPDETGRAFAAETGIELLPVPGGTWQFDPVPLAAALQRTAPHMVHMHSVFIPRQAMLAAELRRRRIPYIITPHGGLARVILKRNRVKKLIYSLWMERPRFRGAAAIAVAAGEERDIHDFVRNLDMPMPVMPIPVDAEQLGSSRWSGDVQSRRFVFLGRFDVHVKGLDTLVKVASLMPEARFDLYGSEDPKTLCRLRQIQRTQPPNVTFHSPVHGAAKTAVLCGASIYLQLSRAESFGISIAEAMFLGIPCAISNTINMAGVFRTHDLGMTLESDAPSIAATLRQALAAPANLQRWSQRCADYAARNYESTVAAGRYIRLYEQCGTVRQGKPLRIPTPAIESGPPLHVS
jgi:glycosyltransferase involved in cell wall biosynthesis